MPVSSWLGTEGYLGGLLTVIWCSAGHRHWNSSHHRRACAPWRVQCGEQTKMRCASRGERESREQRQWGKNEQG